MRPDKYFILAKKYALKGDTKEAKRTYRLGAVGIRSDGAVVFSNNIPNRHPNSGAHAESRLSKKLDVNSIVFIVRVRRDYSMANARPCKKCISILKSKGVKKVYYSISNDEYGIITLN